MLYVTSKDKPNDIRVRMRMRDLIDSDILRHAVDLTMERYPYFCVELKKKEGQYIFEDNPRPVVIANTLHGVSLNSKEANYHMIAFSWADNWIMMDVFHGMTDGTGAYEILRTLLFYYCRKRYGVKLKEEGIRLVGDEISVQEWEDPLLLRNDLPNPKQHEKMSDALNPIALAGLENDHRDTVYSIAISEDEFMKFIQDNNSSPGQMVSLLLSRAIKKLYPDADDIIRITLCVNQRKALHLPLAHQCLVGGAFLEYNDSIRDLPLSKQAMAFREMLIHQTQEENVLMGVSSIKGIDGLILSKESDQDRLAVAHYVNTLAKRVVTATVSYVGKANYHEAEQYIRDFRLWTTSASNGLTVEISAVNGRFTLDFLQVFSSPVFVNAFLEELEENGIVYDLQDVNELKLANIELPWTV